MNNGRKLEGTHMGVNPVAQLYIPYNLYFKGSLIKDTARKLAAAIAPTCALLHNKTSQIATDYLIPAPSGSLFFDELDHLDYAHCAPYSFGYYSDWLKDKATTINSSPLIGATKAIFITKQTIDFCIASVQWFKGQRSPKSLFFHSSHFIISCAPILMSQTQFGKTWEGQLMLNISMLGSLLTSASYDIFPAYWQLNGQEASPSSTWLKDKFFSLSSYLISRN